jgi:hypothetical protein
MDKGPEPKPLKGYVQIMENHGDYAEITVRIDKWEGDLPRAWEQVTIEREAKEAGPALALEEIYRRQISLCRQWRELQAMAAILMEPIDPALMRPTT